MRKYMIPVLLIVLAYNTDLIKKLGSLTGLTNLLIALGWLKGNEFDPLVVTFVIILIPILLAIPYVLYEICYHVTMKIRYKLYR